MYLDLPKATWAVTQFLSMQNDACTLQEQLGFSHAFHIIVLCWCCQCLYKTLQTKVQTVYDLYETLCESLAAEMSVKTSSLDFSPKLNGVKYKLDVSGFVWFTLNEHIDESLFHAASKCKYSVTNFIVQNAFKLPKIKSLNTIDICMDPLRYLKWDIYIKHLYLLYVLSSCVKKFEKGFSGKIDFFFLLHTSVFLF